MNKNMLIMILIMLILLAWAPWVTEDYAEQKVIESFNNEWEGVQDGCGFNCPNCGIYNSEYSPKKVIFGYKVTLLYSCGMKASPPTGLPDWNDQIFVSFLGTTHTLSHERNLD
jgi:hypothetical protein